jgi:hypothetical protein
MTGAGRLPIKSRQDRAPGRIDWVPSVEPPVKLRGVLQLPLHAVPLI